MQVAHAFDFYGNLTLIPAAKLARVPVVIGSHRQLGDLMTPAQFRAQAAAFGWCDAIICNSQAAADRLIATGLSPNKITIIGNALPAAAFSAAPAALPKRPGVVRVGMVARMNHRYKNHSGFLRIAAQIRQRIPSAEFLLVGDGPLRQELEREAASLGLGASAIFLGDRQDMPAVLVRSTSLSSLQIPKVCPTSFSKPWPADCPWSLMASVAILNCSAINAEL